MSVNVVLGLQWGDEGKGKIVDYLSSRHDVIIRFHGGPNAGHTIITNHRKYIFHHIPSGILHPQTECVIGNGVIIDLISLKEEIEALKLTGIDPAGRLWISSRAHLIFPFHKQFDAEQEKLYTKNQKIGTTGRGIGPAYSAKYSRIGLRVSDLFQPEFKHKLEFAMNYYNAIFEKVLNSPPFDLEEVAAQFELLGEYYRPYIIDTHPYLQTKLQQQARILLEGAQGTMLDIDYGTYPYVTSSHCLSGGAAIGSGLPVNRLQTITGILKAYTTRVGNGPFPTELLDMTGEKLRNIGGEFGSTTGRPRRCGWLDLPAARYAVQLNGITELAITKLDVLDSFDEIKVCTAYQYRGSDLDYFPDIIPAPADMIPVYQCFAGWQTQTSHLTHPDQLPTACRTYLTFIQDYLQIPIRYVSTGAERNQLIHYSE
ncbi:MAG: adenylosuccinate synthase [Candidatus Delongbacteria bacterium]|nr:adenylosuccinate synthase [Candidatus Delongbacteria bacterium]